VWVRNRGRPTSIPGADHSGSLSPPSTRHRRLNRNFLAVATPYWRDPPEAETSCLPPDPETGSRTPRFSLIHRMHTRQLSIRREPASRFGKFRLKIRDRFSFATSAASKGRGCTAIVRTVIKRTNLLSGDQLWQYFATSDAKTSSSFPLPSTAFRTDRIVLFGLS